MMKPNIGISEKNLKIIAELLGVILANEMVLYIKTRKAHWNVSGESFMELHKLFEAQYTQLEESIDEVAERIGKLGHKTTGTMQDFIFTSFRYNAFSKISELILSTSFSSLSSAAPDSLIKYSRSSCENDCALS